MWKYWCRFFGHRYSSNGCPRCGHTTLSRAELLKQLMPELHKLFKQEYEKHGDIK